MDDDSIVWPVSAPIESGVSGERGRVYEHVDVYGPLPVAGLQADLFPLEPRRFGRVLAVLLREGVLERDGGTVRTGVDPERLGTAECVDLPSMSVTLRPAVGSDFQALLGLVRSVASASQHPHLAALGQDLLVEGHIHRWDRSCGRTVSVAVVEDRLGGWAHLSTVPGENTGTATLTGAVAPWFRDEGIGSRLLQYALDQPATRDHRRVSQQIPAHDDDAFQFLRTHGWSVDAAGSDADELRVVQDV